MPAASPLRLGSALLASSAVKTPAKARSAPLAQPPGYVLAWHDEFTSEGLPDPQRWTQDTARNRAGWCNEELQYYAPKRPANARVEGGRLVIKANREDLSGQRLRDWGGQRFSSARVTTRGRAKWRGGYFEIRAKMPCVRGTWPAIWLLPDNHRGNWLGGEMTSPSMSASSRARSMTRCTPASATSGAATISRQARLSTPAADFTPTSRYGRPRNW